MLISEVLKRKASGVRTVPPDASVHELLRRLAEHHVGALVVSEDGTTPVGIVSERDVVRRLVDHGPDLLARPVSAIMTREVRTCGPGEGVEALMSLMTERRFRHVPVVEDGRLVGIVSIGDVVKERIDEVQAERDHLVQYIGS